MTKNTPTLSSVLAREIDAAGVKHEALAYRLGMSRQSLSDRYRGRVKWRADEVPVICQALGIGIGNVYAEAGL